MLGVGGVIEVQTTLSIVMNAVAVEGGKFLEKEIFSLEKLVVDEDRESGTSEMLIPDLLILKPEEASPEISVIEIALFLRLRFSVLAGIVAPPFGGVSVGVVSSKDTSASPSMIFGVLSSTQLPKLFFS